MILEIKDEYIKKALSLLKIRNHVIIKFIAFIETLILRMESHHIFLLSAGIAFNILLYLIPMFLMAIFVVNMIFEEQLLVSSLITITEKLFPPTDTTSELLSSVLKEVNFIFTHSSIAGIIGLIALLWLSSTLLSSLRSGLNTVFSLPSPKIFIFYRLKDILLSVFLAILILLSSYIAPIASIISSFFNQFLPSEIQWIFSSVIVTSFSLISSFLLFFFMFRFLPNVKMPNFVILFSTGLCIILVEASRYLFGWYLVTIASYGKFYGTYAVLVSVAIWMYYLTFIIMASAEFSKLIYDLKHN